MVFRCCRCGEFKEREEMETKKVRGILVTMCKSCWAKKDAKFAAEVDLSIAQFNEAL